LALPAIFAGIAEPLISLADTAIIGHLGKAELGGVGVATSFFTFIIWTLAQTRTAISSLVAQYLGKGRLNEISSLVPQALLLNLLLGLVVLGLTLPFSETIFRFYEAEGGVLESAMDYFAIRGLGFPVVLFTFAIFGVFRGMQNTLWAMQISLVGGAVNLVLDLMLVYGIEGLIAPMGVEGAATASLIAQLVMMTLALVFLFKKVPEAVSFSKKLNHEILNLLGISGNLIIRTVSLNLAFFLATRFATSYGEQYIAAHTIALNIWLFSAFFIDGYANAGNALGGKLLGENNYSVLYKMGLDVIKISVLIALCLSTVYGLAYTFLGQLFSQEQEVIVVFESIFWLVIISQPINAVAFSLDGIFKGMGKAKILRNVLLAATFLGFAPTIFLADYFNHGLASVWIAFLMWMLVRAGSLWFVFKEKFGG